MAYSVSECIIDHLQSSGPQDFVALTHECHVQATGNIAGEVAVTLAGLIGSDLVAYDGGVYELTEWAYCLLDQGYKRILGHAAEQHAARRSELPSLLTKAHRVFYRHAGTLRVSFILCEELDMAQAVWDTLNVSDVYQLTCSRPMD